MKQFNSLSPLSNLSVVRKSLAVLTKADRRKLNLVVIIQVLLGGLDLIGVALVGALGALAVSGVQSKQPGNRINLILSHLHLSNLLFQQQVAVIGLLAAAALVGRTILSVLFTRRMLFFLSRRGADISADLTYRLLKQPLLQIQTRTIQQNLFAVTSGVNAITMGVIGAAVTILSDFSLLVIIGIGLLVLNPFVALGTLLLFSTIAFVLYVALHRRAQILGNEEARLSIATNQKVIEALSAYRQMFVANRRGFYSQEIAKLRSQAAEVMAETTFMPNIGKYVIETTVVVGSLLLGAIQFWTQDASHAVATLTVFMAAGSRLAPAVLRLQQGSIVIKGAVGQAESTLDLMDQVGTESLTKDPVTAFNTHHPDFDASVSLKNICFTYSGAAAQTLKDINLEVAPGKVIAIVGPSGAGKTTLIDIILGLITPESGDVLISGIKPSEAIVKHPGAISYVPQDILISDGSVKDNVVLGYDKSQIPQAQIEKALDIAQLSKVVSSMSNGLDTQVGDRGTLLSGGQRQRLGIARALLTNPKLIVLDEATSSLDGQTESELSDAINKLKNQATVILVAHRLSTVRTADQVIYIAEGVIKATGTFDQIRAAVPDFEQQAQLMSL
jgi:ABC-type bacteriocin/lantibiotic exporter with double-glycine peptidase domain